MGSRRIEDLHPVVARMCNAFIEQCKKNNINIIITSTLRTHAEQLAYYMQGRRPLQSVNEHRRIAGLPPITEKENQRIITSNPISIHEFGCAFDFVIVKDGKAVWDVKADVNENDIPDYEECGIIAETLGFRWGGRFPKKDYVHCEYTGGLTLKELIEGKKPKEVT